MRVFQAPMGFELGPQILKLTAPPPWLNGYFFKIWLVVVIDVVVDVLVVVAICFKDDLLRPRSRNERIGFLLQLVPASFLTSPKKSSSASSAGCPASFNPRVVPVI